MKPSPMTLMEARHRERLALQLTIEAQDKYRDLRRTKRGFEHFEERFEWSQIVERCRLEYRRMKRYATKLEAQHG